MTRFNPNTNVLGLDSDEQDDDDSASGIARAFRAMQRAQRMRPGLETFARALTGDPKLQLKMGGFGASFTDGRNIWITPPVSLGDNPTHQRSLCSSYDRDGNSLCPACISMDELMRTAEHEIGHITGGSFKPATATDIAEVINIAAEQLAKVYEDSTDTDLAVPSWRWRERIVAAVNKANDRSEGDVRYQPMGSYLALSRFVSPWLPGVLNALEDARVNEAIHMARAGSRRYFRATVLGLLRQGIELPDGTHVPFSDRPVHTQVTVAALVVASGYHHDVDLSEVFDPEVAELLLEPEIEELLGEVIHATGAADIYKLGRQFLAAVQARGWLPDPEPEGLGEAGCGPSDPTALQLEIPNREPQQNDPGDDDDSDGANSGTSDSQSGQEDSQEGGQSGPQEPQEPEGDDSPAGDGGDEQSAQQGAPSSNEEQSHDDDDGDDAGTVGAPDGGADAGPDDGRDETSEEPDGSSQDDGADPATESDPAAGEDDPGPGAPGDEGPSGDDDPGADQPDAGQDAAEAGSAGGDQSSPDEDPDGGNESGVGHPDSDDGSGFNDGDEDDDSDCAGNEGDGAESSGSGAESGLHGDGTASTSHGADGDEDARRASDDADGVDSPMGGHPGARDEDRPDPGDRDEATGPGPEVDDDDDDDDDFDDEGVDDSGPPRLSNDEIERQARQGHADLKIASGHPDELEQLEQDYSEFDPNWDDEDWAEEGLPERPEANFTSDQQAGKGTSWSNEDSDMKTAGQQHEFFQGPDDDIVEINIVRFDRGPVSGSGWNKAYLRNTKLTYGELKAGRHGGRWADYRPEMVEPYVRANLNRARLAFTENKKVSRTRNQKSGRLYAPTAGRKLKTGDVRVFGSRIKPDQRDYVALIGIDASGSTNSGALAHLKQAAHGQAELLYRLGIPFAMYAHTECSPSAYSVDLIQLKGFDEPWGPEIKLRLRALVPMGGNLDGHNVEVYRKLILDEIGASRTSEGILLYYTDGAMPASNYSSELEVLTRYCRLIERDPKFHVLAVGAGTDSPKDHGLDTVRVDGPSDLEHVIKRLQEKLQ